jgi:hypothetical protein
VDDSTTIKNCITYKKPNDIARDMPRMSSGITINRMLLTTVPETTIAIGNDLVSM